MRHFPSLITLFTAGILAGCDAAPPASSGTETGASAAPANAGKSAEDQEAIVAALRGEARPAANPHGSALPPGHPPIDGAAAAVAPAVAPPTPGGVELRFTAPDGWESSPVANAMRKANYTIPGDGDGEPAEVVVYYFGPGQGGATAANVDRWRGQFAELTANKSEMFPDAEAGATTLVDLAGDFNSGMPGMGGGELKTDYRMIGGIIEAGDGPWFVKATGPNALVEAHRQEIIDFIMSARVAE